MPLPDGTVVLAGNGLGTIVRAIRRHRTDGYDVISPEYHNGAYSEFCPTYLTRAAVVGTTVCEHPSGAHSCGRTHVDAATLATLPRAAGG